MKTGTMRTPRRAGPKRVGGGAGRERHDGRPARPGRRRGLSLAGDVHSGWPPALCIGALVSGVTERGVIMRPGNNSNTKADGRGGVLLVPPPPARGGKLVKWIGHGMCAIVRIGPAPQLPSSDKGP
jgi:hypothetical protein